MKITNKLIPMLTALCLSMLFVAQASGEAVIKLVGYSIQEVHDLHLDTQRSMPLDVIGVGQPVYMKSAFEGTYSWSLVAPDGSASTLSGTTDREVYLIPDMVGSYVVTLSFTDTLTTTDEITITGATYVGVGTIGGATPGVGQCGMCHSAMDNKVPDWELTGHSDLLERALNGTASSHYGPGCIECHTTGFDSVAVNGGFDDVAGEEGWTFPETLEEGVYDDFVTNYPLTAQLGNIQCESCHGPGSEHNASGPIGISYDAGVCAYCHYEETHHIFPLQWSKGPHGKELEPDEHFAESGSCVPCHTAQGFFEVNLSATHESTAPYKNPMGQTCVVCHDPHSAEHEYQLRAVEDYLSVDTLTSVAKYASDGTAAHACDVCHHLRPGRDVPGNSAHYGFATEMLDGTVGYRYEGETYPEMHAHGKAIEKRCVGCHMTEASDSLRSRNIGGHTFKMHAAADAEQGLSEDIYLTEACSDCHAIGEDLDYRGVQTLVHSLLDDLASMLPQGSRGPLYSESDVEAGDITVAEMNAAYNYNIVYRDGSYGIHNPPLAIALLTDAIESVGGVVIGPVCDLNMDDKIDIADVIALLLLQRDNPADPRGDVNGDGSSDISDAILLLTHIMAGTCVDASALLAAAGESGPLNVARLENLSQSEIEYLEQMMAQMDLTEEQEAAFRVALYGKAGASSLPKAFALDQNSPNPFNPATTISYSVPEGNAVYVRLDIFDIRGRLVRTLVDETKDAGTYHILWDGTDARGRHLASGVYLYRMRSGEFVQTRKMVLLK